MAGKMTPLDYAKKFTNLDVFLYPPELDAKDGKPGYVPPTGWKTLNANNYRNHTWAKSNWWPTFWSQSIHKQFVKNKRLAVKVKTIDGTVEEIQLDSEQTRNYARHAFSGKASPELLQIAIQLVYRFRPVKISLEQFVAMDFVGTDCNGFVGGYYQRVVKDQKWKVANPSQDPGPDSYVGSLLKLGQEVLTPEHLDAAGTYLVVYCRKDGSIIENNATDAFAHIMLTVPNSIQGVVGTMTVEAVESYPPKLRHVTYTVREFEKARVAQVRGSDGKLGRAGMFRLIYAEGKATKVDQWVRMSRLAV